MSPSFSHYFYFFLLLLRPPPTSPLFPYTTLFRSLVTYLQHANAHGPGKPEAIRGYRGGYLPNERRELLDRKSTRLNSSHVSSSYAVYCLKKKIRKNTTTIILYDQIEHWRSDLAHY